MEDGMAQTAGQYLNSLAEKYTPSTHQFDAARTHRSGIEARLDSWLGVHEMFETGSLKHGTGVAVFSDADYFVSLKGARPTPATSLNKVKEALQDRYPNTTIQIRRPAVVCKFNSGAETVEVVPAYPADSGYWIPDPTGDWMKSYPKDHNNYVNEANKKHPGDVKKLVRLAKAWKYKRNVPVSSCYLEMRAAKYLEAEKYVDLVQDVYYLLKHLEDIQLASLNDPTGLGSRFNAYSSESNRNDALSKLSTAVARAKNAKQYAHDGQDGSAIEQFKLLFN
jgi:hypothetical protein